MVADILVAHRAKKSASWRLGNECPEETARQHKSRVISIYLQPCLGGNVAISRGRSIRPSH